MEWSGSGALATSRADGGDERKIFRKWIEDKEAKDPGPDAEHVYTFNSTKLRAWETNVEIVPVPPVGGKPLQVVQRQPAREAATRAAEAFRHILRRVVEIRADPPEMLWEISSGSESLVLQWCAVRHAHTHTYTHTHSTWHRHTWQIALLDVHGRSVPDVRHWCD